MYADFVKLVFLTTVITCRKFCCERVKASLVNQTLLGMVLIVINNAQTPPIRNITQALIISNL